ncbi:MAG: transketolase [Coriobacteriales bacterium]|jgi:transketolase|nr:transketolase [Coriobacteriales bacterium]
MGFDATEIERRAAAMRRDILKMIALAGSGHPGGSLSATDILAVLYFGEVVRHRPSEPTWERRDRFILSKGHAAPVLYAALAHAGYFEVSELATLRSFGSRLQGHPDSRKLPGVEVATGSLGQGLSIAAGMAYGLAVSGQSEQDEQDERVPGDPVSPSAQQVFVLLGDGELQEGQVWEAAMFAAHQRLGNLVAIVDNNNLQIDGALEDVVGLGDISAKFTAFGWRALEVDGHNITQLKQAFDEASAHTDGPVVVVAHTVKGKGVSFMENQCGWHGKAPSDEQCDRALAELETDAKAATEPPVGAAREEVRL